MVDFHTLNKPEEDMYDRDKVPRMPWHDVGIQVVGQPARDLARHFTQRYRVCMRGENLLNRGSQVELSTEDQGTDRLLH